MSAPRKGGPRSRRSRPTDITPTPASGVPSTLANPGGPLPRGEGGPTAQLALLTLQLEAARTEIARLAVQVSDLLQRVDALETRRGPPPLPTDSWDDAITVDDREVDLSSISPGTRSRK